MGYRLIITDRAEIMTVQVEGNCDLCRFFMECHEELYKCIRGYKNNCIYKYKKLEIIGKA